MEIKQKLPTEDYVTKLGIDFGSLEEEKKYPIVLSYLTRSQTSSSEKQNGNRW